MQPFHLESITAGGDCAVLRIDGEIDAYAAPQLRERVIDLAGNGTVHIIADMRGAGFLDSAGLGALVGSLKRLRARGGSLTLVASTDRILQIFRITGLSDAFALHSCVPDAITADQHWQAAVSGEGGNTGEWCRGPGKSHRLTRLGTQASGRTVGWLPMSCCGPARRRSGSGGTAGAGQLASWPAAAGSRGHTQHLAYRTSKANGGRGPGATR